MRTIETLTDEQYEVIGLGYGCPSVAKEASEASTRWERDLEGLTEYGFGAEEKTEFEALRTEHANLIEAKPAVVAAKTTAVTTRKSDVAAAWTWAGKAGRMIGRLARKDATVADRLKAAYPQDDSKLAGGIGALSILMGEVRDRLPASAHVEARLTEAPALVATLTEAPGVVAVAKAAPIAETKAINILDGKLYIKIRDLNDAARDAIKDGAIDAERNEYRFKYLHHRTKSPKKPPPPTTPPV